MNLKETLQFIFNSFKFWFLVNPWETAIRVRFGKHQKVCGPGVYFKIPHFDRVFIEQNRLRIISMPLQSISTLDSQTITLKCAIGYEIYDISELYNSIQQPETTISNIFMDEIMTYISGQRYSNINYDDLRYNTLKRLSDTQYGLDFTYVKILSACNVKTYRLIMDNHWENEGLALEEVF